MVVYCEDEHSFNPNVLKNKIIEEQKRKQYEEQLHLKEVELK